MLKSLGHQNLFGYETADPLEVNAHRCERGGARFLKQVDSTARRKLALSRRVWTTLARTKLALT